MSLILHLRFVKSRPDWSTSNVIPTSKQLIMSECGCIHGVIVFVRTSQLWIWCRFFWYQVRNHVMHPGCFFHFRCFVKCSQEREASITAITITHCNTQNDQLLKLASGKPWTEKVFHWANTWVFSWTHWFMHFFQNHKNHECTACRAQVVAPLA